MTRLSGRRRLLSMAGSGLLSVAVPGLLSGCGLRPLYGRGTPAGRTTADVAVGTVEGTGGLARLVFLNELVDSMGTWKEKGSRYRLDVSLSGDTRSYGESLAGNTSGAVLTLSARYRLSDTTTGTVAHVATVRLAGTYNRFRLSHADTVAARSARERVARELAGLVRDDLALFLYGQTRETGGQ